MATARLQLLSHDHTISTIDATTPLPVTAGGGGGVDLVHISATVAALGATQLVAAPGVGHRVCVTSFVVQNESAVATTIVLRDGGADAWRVLCQNQGDGMGADFPAGREWRLSANTALNIVLSGANQCGYSIAYFVEAI